MKNKTMWESDPGHGGDSNWQFPLDYEDHEKGVNS